MSALRVLAETGFDSLVVVAWQVAVLVVLVLFVQRAFGRWLTPRWRYALWWLIVARIALPVVPTLPGSPVPWTQSGDETRAAVPALVASLPSLASRPPSLPAPRSTPRPEAVERPRASERAPGSGSASVSLVAEPVSVVPPAPAPPPAEVPWRALGFAAWLAVVSLLLLRTLAREARFRRRLRSATPVRDPELLAAIESCKRRLRLHRSVLAVETDVVRSPAVTGIWRPRLLLPARLLRRLSPEQVRCVLLHELSHVKRGDVLANGAVAAIGCLYWFHPLVRLAMSRLRSAQESLRDWEALTADAPPAQYAETLVRLLETRAPREEPALAMGFLHGGHDIRRRILMITDYDSNTQTSWAVGAGLCLAVAWLSLTSAPPEALVPTPAPVDARPTLDDIEVERHTPEPEWFAELDRVMNTPVVLDVEQPTFLELVELLRDKTGKNFILGEDYFDWGFDEDERLKISFGTETPARALSFTLPFLSEDFDFCYARGVVYIATRDELPEEMDLRFYKVGEFIEDEEWDADMLLDLVMRYASEDWWPWDRAGASIEYWNELLVVRQSDSIHTAIEEFLGRLKNRGARSTEPDTNREDVLRRLRETRISVKFEEVELSKAAEMLMETVELPIIVPEHYADETVTLELRETSALDVIEWMIQPYDLHLRVRKDAVFLADSVDLDLEFYDLAELYGLAPDHEETHEVLVDMITNHVTPWLWDYDPNATVLVWNDMLLVNAPVDTHTEIAQLIDAMERALR